MCNVYIYMYLDIHVYTYFYMYICICIYTCIIYIYICSMYIHIYIYTNMGHCLTNLGGPGHRHKPASNLRVALGADQRPVAVRAGPLDVGPGLSADRGLP